MFVILGVALLPEQAHTVKRNHKAMEAARGWTAIPGAEFQMMTLPSSQPAQMLVPIPSRLVTPAAGTVDTLWRPTTNSNPARITAG